MSKICDRNYGEGSMYTLKWIDGVGSCPNCGQPAICHNLSENMRVMFWALNGSTGTSSMAIARHMTGFAKEEAFGFSPPSDRDDRSRCIKLLQLIPEWIPRLKEMVKYDAPDKKADGFIVNSSGISAYDNSWSKQIPLILQEGKL